MVDLTPYKPVAYVLAGAVAGGLVEASGIIDYALEKVGAYYKWDIVDKTGTWIWGISTAEPVNIAIGLITTVYGVKKGNEIITTFGAGYLAGILGAKLGELFPYMWKQLHPTTTARADQSLNVLVIPLSIGKYRLSKQKFFILRKHNIL